MHARSLGALAETVTGLPALEAVLQRARDADRSVVIVINTDPIRHHRGRRVLGGTLRCRRFPNVPKCGTLTRSMSRS